jgi:hypothetical protein
MAGPAADGGETCDTLQLWTQVVGKVRIALTPLINHWWNATFLVTARGLAALATPGGGGVFDISFDFVNHKLVIETSDGWVGTFALKPMMVADFYAEIMERLHHLGIDVRIWTMPGEIENPIPFEQDRTHAQYDPVYAQRFWRTLVQVNRVMHAFRARFIGKVSPVHFFWGSFDLAVTRFSGRTAPAPKGGTPNVADWVRRFLSMPIRNRLTTPTPACARPVLFIITSWASSSCPTTPSARPAIPMRRCSDFFRRPMRLLPSWRNGTARDSSGKAIQHLLDLA